MGLCLPLSTIPVKLSYQSQMTIMLNSILLAPLTLWRCHVTHKTWPELALAPSVHALFLSKGLLLASCFQCKFKLAVLQLFTTSMHGTVGLAPATRHSTHHIHALQYPICCLHRQKWLLTRGQDLYELHSFSSTLKVKWSSFGKLLSVS